jgi:hypothetical protein
MTAADLAAATALPLPAIRELVNRAADEFHGRLEVTESSEILYSFPRGFTSRYRSLAARLGRFGNKFLSIGRLCLTTLFKAWILVMLIGYFALFMLIALAALTLSAAAGSSNSNSRSRQDSGGGFVLAAHIFDLIIRLWFYSELTRSLEGNYRNPYGNRGAYGRPAGRQGQPLHRAVFSFVFGEKDPNREAEAGEKQALIAHISSNRGLISLPEYMAMTGLGPREAEGAILAFCAEFGGYPEATEEGTIIYRFQDILFRGGADPGNAASAAGAASGGFAGAAAPRPGWGPWRRLRPFSSNSKTMNTWFGIINSVNLLFGGYFFYQALTTGIIRTTEQLQASPRVYGITYALTNTLVDNPHPVLLIGLGLIPLLFSGFFWLIPALRFARLDRENQGIKKRNLRKFGFFRIWERPRGFSASGIEAGTAECRPRNLEAEQEKIITEMGSYSQPDVEVDEGGRTIYNFTGLEREKEALAAGRASVNPGDFQLGKVVFDSE